MGTDQSRIEDLVDPTGGSEEDRPRVGLMFTRAIVEQYGCQFKVASEPGRGTYAQILMLFATEQNARPDVAAKLFAIPLCGELK